jgi:Glycosyltransferase family 87
VRIAIATVALLVALASPSVALASSPSQAIASSNSLQEPLAAIPYDGYTPAGFTSTGKQAVAAAEANSTMQALHRHMHPLFVKPMVWSGQIWAVEFAYGPRIVAEVDETRNAHVTRVWTGPLAAAVWARGHYAPIFDSPWVVIPFALFFLIPFLDVRRLASLRHLDALVLLSFLLSYWLFNNAHFDAGVWLAYPPLIYLLVRMLGIGLRGPRSQRGLAPWLSPRVLGIGLLILVAARVVLSLVDSMVIDVGYASVIGASHAIHGQPLYYTAVGHPDTYGPIAYLAYLPFVLLFPWHGTWNYLPSAHAASLTFDLLTVLGLVLLGRRLRRGREGLRLGLALGWAWAACPFTLMGLMEHSNDGLVAMLSVFALLGFSSPAARGALLGLATAAKFSPGALLPLFAGRRDRGIKGAVICVASFAFVVVVSIGLYLPSGGLTEFYNHTIGFQINRIDVFSPWGMHPGLAPLQKVLEVAAVALALVVAIERRPRSLVQVSALAAAVTIAVQIPATHWFYYYIIWFVPFVLVAVLARATDPAPSGDRRRPDDVPEILPADERVPALVGG